MFPYTSDTGSYESHVDAQIFSSQLNPDDLTDFGWSPWDEAEQQYVHLQIEGTELADHVTEGNHNPGHFDIRTHGGDDTIMLYTSRYDPLIDAGDGDDVVRVNSGIGFDSSIFAYTNGYLDYQSVDGGEGNDLILFVWRCQMDREHH